ncbi:deoxyribonuclease V [Niabella yanshanensis]|uniref:Endonuclease V n=1 Tax=Niabella yanshanensis TaxID=577386 RepID=A0ABZ0W618_9BACT|nr:deoxyribonuclease V [Niabella yanshanensis]WQD38053.1 deoxyribonuclease V [Niabella yanshanensis]
MEFISPDQYDQLTASEAVALQKELRTKINITALNIPIRFIGGADISFNKFEETVYAGIIILKYPEMIPVDRVSIVATTSFPYISGLLAFREIPALLKAWNKLDQKPDVMVLDGQGIAHERRLGIATHFGLLTDTPSIGCAKTRLTGTYIEPADNPFAESPLFHKHERIGTVLRTKLKCKPVFVSPGHKVSIEQSVAIIKNCTRKYRIPEPTRLAHLLVNDIRILHKENNIPPLF